jgi:hypothetical protein
MGRSDVADAVITMIMGVKATFCLPSPLPITGALGPSVVARPILSFRLPHFPAAGARAIPHLRPYPRESS